MTNTERVGDLEIAQDLQFQRREWIIERAGWALMLLITIMALAGVFGKGPLSHARAGRPGDRIWLEYERFPHYGTTCALRVFLTGNVPLSLSRNYLQKVEIENIVPEPESQEAGPEWITYRFKISDSNQPTAVTFYVSPQQVGLLSGRLRAEATTSLTIKQLVYP